ncbi:MAG: hypothetical protein SGILL_000379 [Bacillariaceae sp.]
MSFPPGSHSSPQKTRNYSGNKFVHNSSTSSSHTECNNSDQPRKLTWSQRKALENEEQQFSKMFQLFDNKAEIQYLNSKDDDNLAACVYGDAKIPAKNTNSAPQAKPKTSGYNFDEMLKDEKDMGLGESWRKY